MLLWNSFILNIVVNHYKGILFFIKARIVRIRSNIINRNHVCYALNDKIHVVFFSLFLQPPLCFSLNLFLLMFIFILHFVFYGLFLSTWCVSSLPGFFFSYLFLFSFFSSFCFTAYPLTINRFLFAHDFQQRFTILSSIYLFICCHRSTRT